jgi:hypothetical protein
VPLPRRADRGTTRPADVRRCEAYQHLGRRPEKFVHGYGIFQYDLQLFRRDPDFFLTQRWQDITACVDKMMTELRGAHQ